MIDWLKRVFAEKEPPVAEGDPERVADVEGVLEELRPVFRADGGDIRLIAVVGGRVQLRLFGACSHCHISMETLNAGIEPRLKQRFAWFEGLDAV